MVSGKTIAEKLKSVRECIVRAAVTVGRDPSEIKLVAVSKKKSVEQIWEAFQAGQRIFGENYVQEALKKKTALDELCATHKQPPAEFHLIGPLQRNKAKLAVGAFSVIESVDSIELAGELAKRAAAINIDQDIYLQINISGEETKSGISPEDAIDIFGQVRELPHIKVKGLMCIGKYQEDASLEAIRRREFSLMREIRESIERTYGVSKLELSMGMSEDFELAVANGASVVRVGTAIFGGR